MKKALLMAGILAVCTIPTACSESSEEKVQDAKEDAREADLKMKEEVREWRDEMNEKIQSNNERIAEYRARVSEQREENREAYNARIDELEARNKEMKARIEDYDDSNYPDNRKENWEAFKRQFNSDMDELGDKFRNAFDGDHDGMDK